MAVWENETSIILAAEMDKSYIRAVVNPRPETDSECSRICNEGVKGKRGLSRIRKIYLG